MPAPLAAIGTLAQLRLASVALLVAATGAGCSWVERANVSSGGAQANSYTESPVVSRNGRYLAFYSAASTLVPGDTNFQTDVFVRDTLLGTTTRVSVDSAGNQTAGTPFEIVGSTDPSLSADGRYVAFASAARDLVPDDTNEKADIFLHDRTTGVTSRISLDSEGEQADADSDQPYLSADGHYIAFTSYANLIPGDWTGSGDYWDWDVYLYHRDTGNLSRVSINNAGQGGLGSSNDASLSDNGRYIVFQSNVDTLVADDTNEASDIFVRDRVAGTTTRVSVDSAGNEGNDDSSVFRFGDGRGSNISADGRFVAFGSTATNLAPPDQNAIADVFLHDRATGTTRRVSVDNFGNEADGEIRTLSVSHDGRFVAFESWATNLVPDDTNGYLDIFVRDTLLDTTTRVSLTATGGQANFPSVEPVFSRDGRYIAFVSYATNLATGDTNGQRDVFVRAFPQPAVTSMSPDMLPVGATTSVTVAGNYFFSGTNLYADATITNLVIVDEHTITADFTIPAGAAAGTRNLVVGLPGTNPKANSGASDVCNDCFTVF